MHYIKNKYKLVIFKLPIVWLVSNERERAPSKDEKIKNSTVNKHKKRGFSVVVGSFTGNDTNDPSRRGTLKLSS